jgi:hypothetical protein
LSDSDISNLAVAHTSSLCPYSSPCSTNSTPAGIARSDAREPKYDLSHGRRHIENLGIYELPRRRCELIIAIDAEADPEMSFGSLVTLQRYARIDPASIFRAEIRRDAVTRSKLRKRRPTAPCRASRPARRR